MNLSALSITFIAASNTENMHNYIFERKCWAKNQNGISRIEDRGLPKQK